MCDVFEFIDGKKIGAMKRFGDAVRKGIGAVRGESVCELAEFLGITADQLLSISRYFPELFRSDIIEGCASALQLDLRDCFKKSQTLDPKQKEELSDCVTKWGPRFAGGATSIKPSQDDFTDLFLLTHALQQLDIQMV
jgi:hypothetical protein